MGKKINIFLLSIQHLFAMFGATILMPRLIGMDPSIALICSGLGTLIFIYTTKGMIPSYLGSSFAFINPILIIKSIKPDNGILDYFIIGLIIFFVYIIISIFIYLKGYNWISSIFPSVVIGPIIMVIGLGLVPSAIKMIGDSFFGLSSSVITIISIILFLFSRKNIKILAIILGISMGYIYSFLMGQIKFDNIINSNWISIPSFSLPFIDYIPNLDLITILLILPISLVTIVEHIGHQTVLCDVINQKLNSNPGLHISILGDGFATFISTLLGGPPNTTYAENISVISITKNHNINIFILTSFIAIFLGFCGKLSVILSSIPESVMGGASLLLFGIIACSGLNIMIKDRIDLKNIKNIVIVSLILAIGISGFNIKIYNIKFDSLAICSIVGILLNILIPNNSNKV